MAAFSAIFLNLGSRLLFPLKRQFFMGKCYKTVIRVFLRFFLSIVHHFYFYSKIRFSEIPNHFIQILKARDLWAKHPRNGRFHRDFSEFGIAPIFPTEKAIFNGEMLQNGVPSFFKIFAVNCATFFF